MLTHPVYRALPCVAGALLPARLNQKGRRTKREVASRSG